MTDPDISDESACEKVRQHRGTEAEAALQRRFQIIKFVLSNSLELAS